MDLQVEAIFFEIYEVPEYQRTRVLSFHLTGAANACYRSNSLNLEKVFGGVTDQVWSQFIP